MSGEASQAVSGTISIGEVQSLLKREFPDVTISKIRFLETEGLVSPERTPSGYRRFSQHDVDRLREVLRMQRDEYLPLQVIRDQLEEGRAQSAPTVVAGSGANAADFRPGAGRVRLTRAELAEQCGLDEAFVRQLEEIDLVWATATGHYDEDALAIATVVARLSAYGVEPRHLRQFRRVTERDHGLVDQMVTPYKNARDRTREREMVRELAALVVQLHASLLRAELLRDGSR
ncbi:MAG: MerR family transcriptional regulator [Candidatus Nanopelagicales bacterium]|jgi:DNA-binding transcriptional MerR regulator